jgi:hypothetical protein
MTRRSWEGILCILLWWIQVCHLVILCPFFWILDTALLFGSLRLSSFLLYFYLRPLRTWCYGRGERDCWTQLLPWCCYFTAKAENSVLCKNSPFALSPKDCYEFMLMFSVLMLWTYFNFVSQELFPSVLYLTTSMLTPVQYEFMFLAISLA